MIGGGPAGLAYALLVAEGNFVTVMERTIRLGGAFRLACRAPLFEAVEAREDAFGLHIEALAEACQQRGVRFRFGVDALAHPSHLLPFDLVVVATGAHYRFGLGPVVRLVLGTGLSRPEWVRQILGWPRLRDWLYHRARAATGEAFRAVLREGQELVIIGDARSPGKAAPAIRSAFAAALLGDPLALEEGAS